MRRRKFRPRRMQLRKIPPNANPTACSRARKNSKSAWRSLPTSVRKRKQPSVRRSVVVSKGGRLLGQPIDPLQAAIQKRQSCARCPNSGEAPHSCRRFGGVKSQGIAELAPDADWRKKVEIHQPGAPQLRQAPQDLFGLAFCGPEKFAPTREGAR